ncbi:MAG: hypothetical protein DHS20C10_00770 [marine bacterium B5-7]|nr:MAG: hypothetical protein DHS20C10_00770 [marine bacterium B5-7]
MINGDSPSNPPPAPAAAESSATHDEEEMQLAPASSRKPFSLPDDVLALILVCAINSAKPEDVMPLMATLSVVCKQFYQALDNTVWRAAYQTRFPLFYQKPTNERAQTLKDCVPQILWQASEHAPSSWKEASRHTQTNIYPAIKQALMARVGARHPSYYVSKEQEVQAQLSTLNREPNIPLYTLLGLDKATSTQEQLRHLLHKTALLEIARTLQLRNFLGCIYVLACTLFVNGTGQPNWNMSIPALNSTPPPNQGINKTALALPDRSK